MFWPHVFLYTMCTPGTLLIGPRDYKMVVSRHVGTWESNPEPLE